MKRSTRNAAKTRQEIIEKSAPIFNIHGYAGTKMQMLVDATGYQMGGIYRHFGTKMDLAKAAFQYNYETLVRPNLDVDPNIRPEAQLLSILDNYQKMVFCPKVAGGCPLLNTAMEVDDTDEEFRQLAKSYVEEVISTIAQILQAGKVAGDFNPTIEPRKEAQYLFACVEGAIMVATITKDVAPLLDIFERIRVYIGDKVTL